MSAPRLLQRAAGWFGGLPDRVGHAAHAGSAQYARPAPVSVPFDQALLWVLVALLSWGLVMVYSASIAMPDNPRFAHYAPTHFFTRHALYMGAGFIAALLTVQAPMALWERVAPWLFVAALLLLAAVLIPGLGKMVNGARRWLAAGPIGFQPSELAKFSVLVYAAGYMVRRMEVKERFFRAVLPMGAAVAIMGVLLLAEPDMGAFLVIAVIAMGILFLGGVNARMFFLIAGVLVAAFALMIASSSWRRERVFAYLDPFSEEHALGKGYQLSHALIAIGRGEIFGVGLGGSVEKLHWLPEAHTDFLLAVIGEEFGLVGVLVLILLFLWVTRRIMLIGRQAIALDRVFSGLVAQGVAIWIGFQAFINMGVNLGALPTKGLTLPLMSFGGSAILMNLIALAVVLRVDYENKLLMRGGRT
ncbi:putative lipid II flippase FtsW [Verminephrobacter aporrectodeae]|uniref:Probable peptidoglycan glycosyltransferase FtsW n=1 Tax=Verminephrobacter aporrectodeae subsp. tuberculatae TaxID=1110392 RepID=A0ABT3KSE4_9BURK|nr:putative lipid II flippase FtsW [Verminephrobacter aporrectodeae]MCW5219990.1 putative lipid II flippase FtsW [Verminephrobacter aporrectodeae subsp. tuberculatae]MCW5256046.1 putative lipid II flippase FtsW [Verminephrobacter aporrectodeae subsp. tuberculatae]MCW5289278.1 putative lipid II flippase FtsW [Verminephrobacter aporrectodeae subsp. tuberculatae]MCW5321052.1 putative lipid II flippase FtsW [Verminephrobacter aporrectodeae subsp. tuberculatae]MCW8165722.1 putative lipid II flippas